MSESRVRNSKRNMMSGMVRQMLNILLPFITRTLILHRLGAEYQGLDSLFRSILHVLNLADLGFSTAVVYVLYKPIAEKDYSSVCAIIAYLKKVYRVVGLVILCVGMAILPVLPQFISGTYPSELNIYVIYVLYLINAVVSYWGYAYKSTLLTAMQREDVVNNIYTVSTTGLRIAQVVLLLVTADYYFYIAAMPLFTIINNVLIAVFSRKLYPFIEAQGKMPEAIRKDLNKQIRGIVINRVGDVARNGFDSIFISSFLGLVSVAIYDNYYYIFYALYSITLTITHAVQASIGNSMAIETTEKNYGDMNRLSFMFTWFTGWCSICLCCLYQPFMLIWMNGNAEMLFSAGNMLLFVLYYYAISMNSIRNLYVNGAGLYWELRLWFILEAVGNIVLNLALGYFFGVTGIILATIITIFVCNFITRINVLFKVYFKRSPMDFYRKHLIWFGAFVLNCAITYGLCAFITVDGFVGLFLKAAVCAIVPNIVFFALYCKTSMFRESAAFVRRVIKR